MTYVVKWTDPAGRTHVSEPQESPADAIRFSESPQLLQAHEVWAENDRGHKFPISVRGEAGR
jgi:hypothetical protein